jgi:hypothetical protein
MTEFFHVLRRAVARPQARIELLEALVRMLRARAPFSKDTTAGLDAALACAADGYRDDVGAAVEMAYLFARKEIEDQEVTR